jgi:serine/threonine protein kinase
MNPVPDPSTADDPRVIGAVQEYLAELEAGRRPDHRAYAERFPELRDAIEPYLDALDMVQGAAVQAQPALLPAREPLVAEPLGDFHIVREIGRGGMGVVYEAVQRSLGRRVALKVLPFAAALDSRQLQRFHNEAQAAAHLHHQNIVPVYAVGAERGVHFYAMQLIDGQNFATVLGELVPRHAAVPGTIPTGSTTEPYLAPSRTSVDRPTVSGLGTQLSTQRSTRLVDYFRTVAGLAAQAADALDYAHNLGIVHRDVKPGNLLVDDRGNLWITDFGLAQFQASAGLTQSGDLLGTLRYMSPEQAGGQRVLIDHRTDIYSLGATLYEMLSLRPIFDGEDRQGLLNKILHEEPRPPRAVARFIPPELDTIVLKAVSKAPADRYATARELADDLRRFLRHEPILARRPTLAQRGRKWLRRHPSVVAAAVVLLVLVTAGSLLSAWMIRDEQEKTRLAYQAERQRAEDAEAQFRLAQRAVDEMIRISREELADNPMLQSLAKRVLMSALVYYQEFIDRRRDDPAAQEELLYTKAKVEQMLADLAALQGTLQRKLLEDPAVLTDLELSEGERARIVAMSSRQRKERLELLGRHGKGGSEDLGSRFVELARAHEAAVQAVLTPAQLVRLGQIALQFKGLTAFRESDVAAALKLTADQRRRIRDLEAELFGGPQWNFGKGKGPKGPDKEFHGVPGEFKKKPPELSQRDAAERDKRQRALVERVVTEILTGEQARAWHEMTGAPFRGTVMLPGPFGPPPVPPGQPR